MILLVSVLSEGRSDIWSLMIFFFIYLKPHTAPLNIEQYWKI